MYKRSTCNKGTGSIQGTSGTQGCTSINDTKCTTCKGTCTGSGTGTDTGTTGMCVQYMVGAVNM